MIMVDILKTRGKYPNIQASDAALRRIRREVAAVRSGERRSTILMYQDSTGEGFGAGSTGFTDGARKRRPASVAASILSSLGVPARADAFFGSSNVPTKTVAYYNAYNTNVVLGPSWVFNFNAGSIGNALLRIDSPNTDSIVFTPEKSADRCRVFTVFGDSGGTYTVTDGSGTLATVSTSGASAYTPTLVSRASASVSPLSLQRSNGGQIQFSAIDPYNSTVPELCFLDGGAGSSATSNYLSTTNFFDPLGAAPVIAANMHYVELGLNDKNNGVSLSTYLENLAHIIDNCVAISGPGSVIVGTPSPALNSTAFNFTSDWYDGVLGVAYTKDIILIDHYSALQSYEAESGLYYDTVHLKKAGYAMKGALLARVFSL